MSKLNALGACLLSCAIGWLMCAMVYLEGTENEWRGVFWIGLAMSVPGHVMIWRETIGGQ